jgi:hypothetical protein
MTLHNSEPVTNCADQPANLHVHEDPFHHEHRHTKLGHIIDSIRDGLANEHDKLFHTKSSTHQRYQTKLPDHLDHIRHSDEVERRRVEDEMASETSNEEVHATTSPAIEARKSNRLNENNMGVINSHEGAASSWGWPGLGAFAQTKQELNKPAHPVRTGSAVGRHTLEPRVEAAAWEAIDSAAEGESYGWAGLGDWPAPKPKH